MNQLGKEKSPYLLQHKDNPIHWYAWGSEAFKKAQLENKIIFLSIGYSTCYWCHMMEKDSFEIQEVADVLNENFISIKVDREEHPEVDKIYMDAVMGMTGHGGWPLTVFLTPDLKPFFGGTFFRRQQFLHILDVIHKEWQADPDKVFGHAEEIYNFLKKEIKSDSKQKETSEILDVFTRKSLVSFDPLYGGFGRAPKFPHSMQINFLMRVYKRNSNSDVLNVVERSLLEMAKGGIFDQIGGGFHRYSTDEKWFAPHFEKMLYDNALLSMSYLEAFQITGKEVYKQVAQATLDYVIRDMTDSNGGFYAAEDAGDVNEEGDYYVWKYDELKEYLSSEEFTQLQLVYSFTEAGNWEKGNNILFIEKDEQILLSYSDKVQKILGKLLDVRSKRKRPRLDYKILTGWNALMISAMAKAFQVTQDKKYLDAARKSLNFIKTNLMTEEGDLLRRFCEGEAKYSANLDDYAFLVAAVLDLYQTEFLLDDLLFAKRLQEKQNHLFWDEKSFGYFFSLEDQHLIVRKKDFYDGALPSGNSVSLLNLQKLAVIFGDLHTLDLEKKLLNLLREKASDQPLALSQGVQALDFDMSSKKEIVIVGNLTKELEKFLEEKKKEYHPNLLIVVMTNENAKKYYQEIKIVNNRFHDEDYLIYLCENQSCQMPTKNLRVMENFL